MKIFDKFRLGKIEITPFYTIEGNAVTNDYSFECDGELIRLKEVGGKIADEITFKLNETGYSVRRVIKNLTDSTININSLGVTFTGITFGLKAKDDYFYSLENARIYETSTFPIDYKRTANDASNSDFDVLANNRWADPGVVRDEINASPYQPFPAILLSNYGCRRGLVHGSLSQDVFYHYYLLNHDEAGKVVMRVYSAFKDTAYIELKSGEYLCDEWYIGTTETADDINHLFDGYTKELRKVLVNNYGATNINRDNLVWGSWNDDIFREISHEMLVSEAHALKKLFPTVRWLQVDDGYATLNEHPHGLFMPYDGEDGVDKEKFPKGLKAFTDDIRRIGLRPAVWIGGFCPTNAKAYADHPDWFIDYTKRISDKRPPDVSQPVVFDYMKSALGEFVYGYGFEAIKHDFWSYPFEDSDDLYKNHTASGYEYRKRWLTEIRKRLPKDGYLQTGCDIVMGNPFLGEFFTNYRYGIDVGNGNWNNIKTCLYWCSACLATHTGDLIVPNSDAVGLFGGLSFEDFIFWTNFVMITHTMVELAGRFASGKADKKRVEILQKATCCVDNGQDVFLVGLDYRKAGRAVPEVLYALKPHFSTDKDNDILPIRSVGLFNVDDAPKTQKVKFSQLGLDGDEYIVTNIWTGEEKIVKDEICVTLGAHGSAYLHVSKPDSAIITDSDVKIYSAAATEDALGFKVAYPKTASVKIRRRPREVYINGEKVTFAYDGGTLRLVIPDEGESKVKIEF